MEKRYYKEEKKLLTCIRREDFKYFSLFLKWLLDTEITFMQKKIILYELYFENIRRGNTFFYRHECLNDKKIVSAIDLLSWYTALKPDNSEWYKYNDMWMKYFSVNLKNK